MVNGVVSLRCPACSRPFISLPQRAGVLVTCPHCACSAPMETYGAAASTSISGRSGPAASLPILKRVVTAKLSGMMAKTSNQPASPRVWPQAPELSPQFAPQTHPVFPPAPVASWPAAPVVETSSPFTAAPSSVQTPAQHGGAPMSVENSEYRNGNDSGTLAAIAAGVMTAATVPHSGAHPLQGMPWAPEAASSGWNSPRDERKVPLGLFLLLLLALGGWLAWQYSTAVWRVDFIAPSHGASLPTVMTPTTEQQPENAVPGEMVILDTDRAGGASEVRRAELPSIAEDP